MCGIIGIVYGPKGPEGEDWSPTELASLMFPDIVKRGPHAWGYMWCPASADQIGYSRTVGRADTKEAIESIDIPDDVKWWVGHVRYATNGAPEHLPNNHPIPHGDIVGVHNGVLRDWQRILDVTGREDPSAQVDSEAIFAAVHKYGMKRGLAKINGDMVTVFANRTEPATLRIARTFNRPLVYAYTPNGSMVFASVSSSIDATGISTSEHIDFKGRYRMLTVREGRITDRTQFRTGGVTPPPTPTVSGRGAMYPHTTRGITDAFDKAHQGTSLAAPRREPRTMPAGTPAVLDGLVGPSRDRRDMMIKKPDMFGGMYLGANTWRLPSGELMNAQEYITWAYSKYGDLQHGAPANHRTTNDH